MAIGYRKRKAKVQTTKVVTAGTTVRFEQPKSSRQSKPNLAVVIAQEANPVTGFVGFLREHAVVGLALGFIIGAQAQTLVKQLIASFIDPAFKLFFGEALSQRKFILHLHGRSAPFGWGAFAYGLLNFIFVLAALYAIIKIFSLDKLDKVKDAEEESK